MRPVIGILGARADEIDPLLSKKIALTKTKDM